METSDQVKTDPWVHGEGDYTTIEDRIALDIAEALSIGEGALEYPEIEPEVDIAHHPSRAYVRLKIVIGGAVKEYVAVIQEGRFPS